MTTSIVGNWPSFATLAPQASRAGPLAPMSGASRRTAGWAQQRCSPLGGPFKRVAAWRCQARPRRLSGPGENGGMGDASDLPDEVPFESEDLPDELLHETREELVADRLRGSGVGTEDPNIV